MRQPRPQERRGGFASRPISPVSIGVFVAASLLHLFVYDLWSALPARFPAGAAAAPISSLGFLCMLDAFPSEKKMNRGLSLALTCSVVTPALARLISPPLLDLGLWRHLYTMKIGLTLMALAVVYLLPLTPLPHAKVEQTSGREPSFTACRSPNRWHSPWTPCAAPG